MGSAGCFHLVIPHSGGHVPVYPPYLANYRETKMLEVTMSEQFQVAIPQEIRNYLHLKAGQKFSVQVKGDSITLVPKTSIESFRGILKGSNTENTRDRSDRI